MQYTFYLLGSLYFALGSLWFIGTAVIAVLAAKEFSRAKVNLAEKFEPVDEFVHRLKNPVTLLPLFPVARFVIKRVRRFLR